MKIRVLFGLMVLLFTVAFRCVAKEDSAGNRVLETLWPENIEEARKLLAGLSLEQKVAQLFMVYARGGYLADDDPAYRDLMDLVVRFEVGGVIVGAGDPYAQVALVNALQQKAGTPLLVAQDLEWGAGMRVSDATEFPSMMALGATRDPALAYAVGRAIAEESGALGVHMAFAPVLDVNNNPENPIINVRSFGEQPELVGLMGSAYIRGLQDGGMLATAKHFPGHGDTATDSHVDLPTLPFSRERLENMELKPFRQAVANGVMAVMTGHLALPQLEPETSLPASLSPRIGRHLLRESLGFKGLIVTDALNMGGVTDHYGVMEAAVRALEAGTDILLMSKDPRAAAKGVLKAVRDGRLSEARIDRSVLRILSAKVWAGSRGSRVNPTELRRHVAIRANKALANEVARRALTLLQHEGAVLPLAESATEEMLLLSLSDDDEPLVGRSFRAMLGASGNGTRPQHELLDTRSHEDDYEDVLARAGQFKTIVVGTFLRVRAWSGRVGLSDAHRQFLEKLIAANKRVVLVAFGNPYIIKDLPRPAVYLATYSDVPAVQQAAAWALFGRSPITGKLPVAVSAVDGFGAGIALPETRIRQDYGRAVGMDDQVLDQIDDLIQTAIADGAFPGAAVAVGRGDFLVKSATYGYFTYDSETPITPTSVFDLASVTKVVGTTTAAMLLYEEGKLDLDAPVVRYLSEFGQNGKEKVTICQLLTHTAGLKPFYSFHTMGLTRRDEVLAFIMKDKLYYPPGSESQYSDLGMITLGLVIEKLSDQSLAAFYRERIFKPLGMNHTGFRPTNGEGIDETIVPTEEDAVFRGRLVQGEVHDETAFILGGQAGHAGLFSTIGDLSRFAHMMVNEGRANGMQFLKPETIKLFTTQAVSGSDHTRALGWDTRSTTGYSSAGKCFGPRSYGHTGYTGTSIWIDPDQKLWVILLTNRVYPTRENKKIREVRPKLADIAQKAIIGPPKFVLPKPPTRE